MKDYFHLDYEYNYFSKHFSANLTRLISISDHYEKLTNSGKEFFDNCFQKKEEFLKTKCDLEDNCNNNMSMYISLFFEQQKSMFKEYNSILNKIKNDFIKPLNNYHQIFSEKYDGILTKLSEGKKKIKLLYKKLTESRKNHYYECKKFDEIKKENKEDYTNENIINQNFFVEETFNIYKKQLNELNDYIEKYNSDYDNIIQEITQLEDNFNSFLKNKFIDLYNIEQECLLKSREEFPFNLYSSKKDLDKFKNELINSFGKENRIEKQKYISYLEFKKMISEDKLIKKNEEKKNKDLGLLAISNDFFYDEFDDEDDKDFNFEIPKKSNEEIIDIFIDNSFKITPIDNTHIQEIKTIISEDISYIKSFVQKYFNSNNKNYYKFENENNIIQIGYIFNIILNTFNSSLIEENIQTLISILLIGERSYYNDIYLCSLIWENNFLKIKDVWEKLIENRLIQKLSFQVKNISEVKKNNSKKEKNSMFSSFIKSNSDFEKNSEINHSLLETLNYDKKIKGYNLLNDNEKLIIDYEVENLIKKILIEFIEHCLNYQLSIPDTVNLIVEIGSKFNLSIEYINYFILCINISSLSICRKIKNYHIKEKIDLIRKNDISLKLNYSCLMKKEKEKKFVLLNIINYLKKDEIIPFFLLKKSISKKLKSTFYLNYLTSNKNISNKIRLEIWKSLLNTKEISKSIKNQILKINENQKKYKIIKQDVERTHIGVFSKEINQSIINILMKVTDLLENQNNNNQVDNINNEYYQGMNYLSAFLYTLTQNEEDSIYLLYSILTTTELKFIYNRKMVKLKNFYLIFEKLLKLFIPQISYCFKKNSIKVNLFITPFVVTIFTNLIQNQKNIPLIVLNIWDEFLLKGWKSLMHSMLTLISFHYEEILLKSGENLLNYLINDLSKSKYFSDENILLWINEKKKFKIKNKYLKLLEEEVSFENKNNPQK